MTKFVPTCTKINILLCRTRVFISHADIEIPPVSTKFRFLPLKKATLNQILAEIEGSTRTRILLKVFLRNNNFAKYLLFFKLIISILTAEARYV